MLIGFCLYCPLKARGAGQEDMLPRFKALLPVHGRIMLRNHDRPRLVAVAAGSIACIPRDNPSYREYLALCGLTDLSFYDDSRIYRFNGDDVWGKKSIKGLFLKKKADCGPTLYDAYDVVLDGGMLYGILPIDATPPDDFIIKYFTWEDRTDSPLRIMAYKLSMDHGVVCVNLVTGNEGTKTVIGYSGIFLTYDHEGRPAEWSDRAEAFRFKVEGRAIPPGEYLEDGIWRLFHYEHVAAIKPCVQKIVYADGTVWKTD